MFVARPFDEFRSITTNPIKHKVRTYKVLIYKDTFCLQNGIIQWKIFVFQDNYKQKKMKYSKAKFDKTFSK